MRLFRYLLQYRVKDMAEFLNNEKTPPLECDEDLSGKTAVISGTSSGIGLETARLFAAKGAKLICLNRNKEKSKAVEQELKDTYGCDVQTILVDFSSLSQTKHCAQTLLDLAQPIDILIHNSGVYHTKKTYSQDDIEMVFQVNHLSSFCLNYLLKERLKKENRARIIHVNSEGYRFAMAGVHIHDLDWKRHLYTGLKSYGAAKTAQLLVMRKFAEYYADSEVSINAMHPGNVHSHIGENNGKLYRWMKQKFVLSAAKEPELSAKALYYLAAAEQMQGLSGQFFNLTSAEGLMPHARDADRVDEVWQKSLELCGLVE